MVVHPEIRTDVPESARVQSSHERLHVLVKPITKVWPAPCGKQHFREIATPDWVSQLRTYHTREYAYMCVKSLPNPAWLFLGNVVSHMGPACKRAWIELTSTCFRFQHRRVGLGTYNPIYAPTKLNRPPVSSKPLFTRHDTATSNRSMCDTQSTSKRHARPAVHVSNIFVWEHTVIDLGYKP